jgi:hypothetical protein
MRLTKIGNSKKSNQLVDYKLEYIVLSVVLNEISIIQKLIPRNPNSKILQPPLSAYQRVDHQSISC